MLVHYWTIELVPSPLSVTRLGVGVVVQDSIGEIRHRFAENISAMLSSFESTIEPQRILSEFDFSLGRYPETPTQLEVDSRPTLSDELSHLARHWNNAVRVSEASVVVAETVDDALQLVYEQVIGSSSVKRRMGVVETRRQMRSEYAKFPLVEASMIRRPTVIAGVLQPAMDQSIVADENVYELTAAFNFATSTPADLQRRVESWSYGVQELRGSGGVMRADNLAEEISVQEDAAVVAVYQGPNDSRNGRVFDHARELWEKVGVTAIDVNNLDPWVAELNRMLAS